MTLTSPVLPSSSLKALTEAAAVINSTLELDSVLQTIARLACDVARAESSSVLLLADRGKKLVAVAATGSKKDAVIGREFDPGLGIPGQVLRSGKPIHVPDVRQNGRFVREIDDIGSIRTRSIIAAPMVHRTEAIGVVEVVNRLDGSDFTETDLEILQVFATLAAGAAQNARAYDELRKRFESLRDQAVVQPSIIGTSAELRRVLDLCERVAPSNATVLILGETGTGKELCARHIHKASRRRRETFAAVNCAALTETLLESELFGYEKGAFTGADQQRRGWFELADGGSLFLDEIGDVSRATQVKLLRVLQEKEFVRVGGNKPISCDVRIIAATNRNLKDMMTDGVFREDLYYRLSVFPIHLPPLRDRRDDVPALVEHFVDNAVRDFRIPQLRLDPDTMDMLTRYAWPGNVRELQNVIERSVLMSDGTRLLPSHLPPEIQAAVGEGEDGEFDTGTLFGQERALIIKALENNAWNQSQTARDLGITRDHLRHRIKKYRIERPADALSSA